MRYILATTSVETTDALVKGLRAAGQDVAGIVTLCKDLMPTVSGNVEGYADAHNIPCHPTRNIDQVETVWQLNVWESDFMVVCWPRMIRHAMCATRHGTIGTHPAPLPHGRGHHPLHWQIAEGITRTCMSFFRLVDRADAGGILHQEWFRLPDACPIADAVTRSNTAMRMGIAKVARKLQRDPHYQGKPQDESKATYWRARTEADSVITPDMDAQTIRRQVAAFSDPFPGAIVEVGGVRLRVKGAA